MTASTHQLSEEHWWGFAALPEGMEYPYNGEENPLTLVCQFHAGEGMVYIFADLDYFFGDLEAESGHLGAWDKTMYRVLYSPTRDGLHEHKILFANGDSAVPEPLYSDLPNWDKPALPKCFGDEIAQDWPGYEILAEVEENDDIGLRFYDCGELVFLIRPVDRAAKRFDRVVCALYSY